MTEQNDTNLRIWNALKTPPGAAMKKIEGGRMSGSTNINAQWRMEAMTRQFGPCGVGWRYTVERLWTEAVGSKGEVAAFAEVDVYVREGEGWSEAIPGIGGNMLVVSESKGLHINDECFKMAVTDALSVAFKALGVAADVYLGVFDDKYSPRSGGGGQRQKRTPRDEGLGECPKCGTFLRKINRKDGSGYFLGCQNHPDCKHTANPPKAEEAKRPAPRAAPPPAEEPQAAGPAQEPEEICPAYGGHEANPDGYCPNEHHTEAPPQEQAAQEWRPQHCGRSMMPRPSSGNEAPRWHCPKCRTTKAMTDEERKRVGL